MPQKESELAALILSPVEVLGAGISVLTWILSVALHKRPIWFSVPFNELIED